MIIRNFPRNFRWDLKLAELPQRKRAIAELLNAEIMRNIIRRRKLFRIGLSEFNLNSPIDCVGEGVCRCVWRHKMIFALSYSSVRHKETKLFAVLFPWGERMLLLYLPPIPICIGTHRRPQTECRMRCHSANGTSHLNPNFLLSNLHLLSKCHIISGSLTNSILHLSNPPPCHSVL